MTTKNKIDLNSTKNPFIIKLVIVFLLFSNIYDMGGAIGIKYISYIIALFFALIFYKSPTIRPITLIIGLLLFVIWPIWELFNGVAGGAGSRLALSQITPFFAGILFYFIISGVTNKFFPLRAIYWGMFSLAIVIISSFLFILQYPDNIISYSFMKFFSSTDFGYFGYRMLGDSLFPNIYFKATLFLVPAYVYFLFTRRIFVSIIVFIAIVVTFSKAGILIALLFFLISFKSINIKSTTKIFIFINMLILVLVLSSLLPNLDVNIIDALTGNSETTIIRTGHINSVIDLFVDKPYYIFLGQGTGREFFSTGTNMEVTNIEVAHIDAIRKFGLFWFILFSVMILSIVVKLLGQNDMEMNASGFALMSIYIASGTNPVLISPLFMIILIASYYALKE